MQQIKKKTRDSNLEILRIISMLLIIGHHFAIYGVFPKTPLFPRLFVDFLAIGGKIGVVCFMMITGYFMLESKYKTKKLLSLIIQTWTYSVGILIVFTFIGRTFSLSEVVHSLFPIIFREYWFITGYVIVYVLSPYLNMMVHKMKRKDLETLLMTFFILFIGINTFFFSSLGNQHEHFTYLIYIYLIGAYIKKYYEKSISSGVNKHYFYGFICCYIFILFSMFGFEIFHASNEWVKTYIALNRIPAFLAGVYLFLYFKTLKTKQYPLLNKIAGMTLGVYLFHDNPFVRYYLWKNLVNTYALFYSRLFIIYSILIILAIFITGIIIEWTRVWLMNRKIIQKIYNKLEDKVLKILDYDVSKAWKSSFHFLFLK